MHHFQRTAVYIILISNLILQACVQKKATTPIDRFALVTRNNVTLSVADTLGSLSVGNGEFTFTADISGLQTFPREYENGIPPGTQSQWAWHSFADEKYSLNDVAVQYNSCDGTQAPYAVQHREGKAAAATRSLRINPHRLQLGLAGLIILRENGEEVSLSDLRNTWQHLDLWTGLLKSTYTIDDVPVSVSLYAHQEMDAMSAHITSPLIVQGRLKIRFRFPYGSDCHTCAGYDWSNSHKHTTTIASSSGNSVRLKRTLDTTVYYMSAVWEGAGIFSGTDQPHLFTLTPSTGAETFAFTLAFTPTPTESMLPSFADTQTSSESFWKNFWTEGGAIDFSLCTDPRARELERRVVLSQYLTKIQCAGSLPPQETGLTMNSWHGKYHLEMHWWHGVHFALWDRTPLLEKSMPWYSMVMEKAKATARWQGYEGARWQKMTDPYGNESPSDIGVFIIWQQPHPIYFAELLYRQNPTQETLYKYREIVFSTADFLASFTKLNDSDGKYHLCGPIVPSQEIFKPTETDDPAYELAYWHYALSVAQQWRERLGMEHNASWQNVIDNLTPLPMRDGLYLPVATVPDAYTDDKYRNDHPSVTAAYGTLPLVHDMDPGIMSRTFGEIMKRWNWDTTWGWDYPMLAMTAARLGKPDQAINALLMDVQKNTYLVNGHNYQDKRLRLYLPGNGGLLAAVAMMAAGWDGNTVGNPGFPKDGKWDVRWEGLRVMP